ncbi:uncharacterized protein LOC102720804 isoform X1 [Oryza brachyantha]|uniref:uncharacterized protein LOC102720804 isoform X1 n=1 Tax=Oryza brachyantha TaxID=4533 RepID=UPI0003EA9600|nr:uncharacterized protein LOC102720804 isoform X1 [Oryza brachyantha]XP_015694305.1 uncharacterized protein LOC102720804 isoform X1 [Oryza brachyantha]XP_015694306.1 uncharacterized protein LOC102720804 isoform X1 [Oryza brachyantha]
MGGLSPKNTPMEEDRSWMYKGRRKRGQVSADWIVKTTDFLEWAFSRDTRGDGVVCPCNYCNNTRPHPRDTMMKHLFKHGFKPDYTVWDYHGESCPTRDDVIWQRTEDEDRDVDVHRMDDMVHDVRDAYMSVEEEDPEPTARAFYEMLTASNQPIHAYTEVSQLDAITRLLTVKSQFSISISGFDALLNVFTALLPQGHKLPSNLYEAKKFLSALNMPYEKIDVCPKYCMLFRKENAEKTHCDKCGESRYVEIQNSDGEKKQLNIARKVLRYLPFIPRLQRLYMSEAQAKQMTWHKHGHRYHPNKMVHPADGEAWKQFDRDFPNFALEARNVKIAVATDGFNPFGMGAASYTCWPVFVIPLNLPPGVCMQKHNVFLSLIIPGPEYPGKKH